MRLTIRDVAIHFPAVFEKEAIGDGEPAYSVRCAIDPKDPQVAAIDAAMEAVAKAKWNEKAPEVMALLKENKKLAFTHGPYRSTKTGEVYAGFDGMFNLGARNADDAPTVYDQFNQALTKETGSSKIYSGAVCDVAVEFWAQDNNYGRRINARLRGIRYKSEGTRFGGSPPASADEFSAPVEAPPSADFV